MLYFLHPMSKIIIPKLASSSGTRKCGRFLVDATVDDTIFCGRRNIRASDIMSIKYACSPSGELRAC